MEYLTGLVIAATFSTCAANPDEESCEPNRPSLLFPRPELNKPLYVPLPFGMPGSRDYYVPKIENAPFMQKTRETILAKL